MIFVLHFGLSITTALSMVHLGLALGSFESATSIPRPLTASGHKCLPDISQNWGPYSPWFRAPSDISSNIPSQCTVTFVQALTRHGARYPTQDRGPEYEQTVERIHHQVKHYAPDYAFIKDYHYALGTDQLTLLGQQELIDAGMSFYARYPGLSSLSTPFVRASGKERVVESAYNWTQGFHRAKVSGGVHDPLYPYPVLVISEDKDSNNSLDHGKCRAFGEDPDSKTGSNAEAKWAEVFVPTIRDRFNHKLPGANLNITEAIQVMDLCPFNTVASDDGTLSPFCDLLSPCEWEQYGYYQSLQKFYAHGAGNPLGPTQGVGFVNELIARLTGTPVDDHTTTNRTLDNSSTTFPLNRTLYADFSHDNEMTSIFFAMGLYNPTEPLSNTTLQTPQDTGGYSASYTVPFAAQLLVEKLQCLDSPAEQLVRVIVNDRVIALEACGGDSLGRCSLSEFVKSLSFARHNGDWEQCSRNAVSENGEAESQPSQFVMDL